MANKQKDARKQRAETFVREANEFHDKRFNRKRKKTADLAGKQSREEKIAAFFETEIENETWGNNKVPKSENDEKEFVKKTGDVIETLCDISREAGPDEDFGIRNWVFANHKIGMLVKEHWDWRRDYDRTEN